ncbi:MAG: radical SAM protein [Treponema sp.]|nr:radical SAM protein [Treponema sp.]
MKEQLSVIKQIIKDMDLPYLRISLIDICNAKCAFCHNEGQNKNNISKGLDSEELFYIADFFKTDFSRVIFTGGEPLLSPLLYESIRIFKSFSYNTGLVTNGILLDENIQKKLKEAGLDRINISINSLEKIQYETFYKVDRLDSILKNIETLPRYIFPSNIKINFIINKFTDFDSETEKFSLLSKEKGFIISALFDIEEKNSNDFTQKLKRKLHQLYGNPREEIINKDKRKKYLLYYENSCVWEFDDFRTIENSFALKDNLVCQRCPIKDNCQEGAYALRLHFNGTFRPCLKRNDNILNIKTNNHEEGIDYV